MDKEKLERTFALLAERLHQMNAPHMRLAVCGGSALIAMSIVTRTTKDVDVVALLDEGENLIGPDPLPELLVQAARDIGPLLGLADNWLNNEPSRNEGGLFQLGLPSGFASRLVPRNYGEHLTIYFIGRLDQIHFKLYAAGDAGGRHLTDFANLKPTADEVEAAAHWSMTHDVSEGYRRTLKMLLKQMGYENVSERI